MNENDVLGFDIAVQYFMFMHQGDSVEQVTNYERCTLLREILPSRNNVVKLSVATQLQYCIEIIFIYKVSVSLDDVRVLQETLYLQLPHKLNQQVLLHNFSLVHNLKCYYHTSTQLSSYNQ
jgi:hypothetical protein